MSKSKAITVKKSQPLTKKLFYGYLQIKHRTTGIYMFGQKKLKMLNT